MRSNNNICPLCRSCIYSNSKSSSNSDTIPQWYKDYEEYIKESDKRCDEIEKQSEIEYIERQEQHKKYIEKTDKQKYELFYNHKKIKIIYNLVIVYINTYTCTIQKLILKCLINGNNI
jgi:hypothetical protein